MFKIYNTYDAAVAATAQGLVPLAVRFMPVPTDWIPPTLDTSLDGIAEPVVLLCMTTVWDDLPEPVWGWKHLEFDSKAVILDLLFDADITIEHGWVFLGQPA